MIEIIKDDHKKYIYYTIFSLLLIIPTYVKFFENRNITVAVGVNLSIYESKPWGQIKTVSYTDKKIFENNNDDVRLVVRYPNKAINVKYKIILNIKSDSSNNNYTYEIDDKIKYNGIYEGNVYFIIKQKKDIVINITLISFQNEILKNSDEKMFNLKIF